ncbi:uncharacterized protein LOC131732885 [Acipenser ruthenus]|uniref:uncharacterized protein LOC131732885 n=1 Tax=Acipenser ruthenus TaxID=7906 RepID=UPI0027411CCC|nr:uncharacterized protein LOC131732885 [Acipenser ruthenus]
MPQLSTFLLLLLLASNAAAGNSTSGSEQTKLADETTGTVATTASPGTPASEIKTHNPIDGMEIPRETTVTRRPASGHLTTGAHRQITAKQTTAKTPASKKESHAEKQQQMSNPQVTVSDSDSDRTIVVVFLFLLFIALAALLVYFCRRLNRETEGGYTLSKLLLANSSDDSGEVRGPRAWLNRALAFFMDEHGRGGEDLEAGGQDQSEEADEEEEGDEEEEEGEEREEEGRKAGTAGEEQERPPTDAENSDSDSDDYSSMEGFDPTGRANGMGGAVSE